MPQFFWYKWFSTPPQRMRTHRTPFFVDVQFSTQKMVKMARETCYSNSVLSCSLWYERDFYRLFVRTGRETRCAEAVTVIVIWWLDDCHIRYSSGCLMLGLLTSLRNTWLSSPLTLSGATPYCVTVSCPYYFFRHSSLPSLHTHHPPFHSLSVTSSLRPQTDRLAERLLRSIHA